MSGLHVGSVMQAAARPIPAPADASTNASCSARTAASKLVRSTMNCTSTLRIWCCIAIISIPASWSASSARVTRPGSEISLPIAETIATGRDVIVAPG